MCIHLLKAARSVTNNWCLTTRCSGLAALAAERDPPLSAFTRPRSRRVSPAVGRGRRVPPCRRHSSEVA